MRNLIGRLVSPLVLCLVVPAPALLEAAERSVTLLVTSGTGGRLEDPGGRTAADLAATVRSLAQEARARGDAVLAIDAGRTVAPYAESRFDGGRMILRVLDAAGVDLWVPSAMDLSTSGGRIGELAAEHEIEIALPFDLRRDGRSPAFGRDLGEGLRISVAGLMAPDELDGAALEQAPAALDAVTAFAGTAEAIRVVVVHSGGHGRDLTSRGLTWRLLEAPGNVDLVIDPDLGAQIELRRRADGRDVYLVGRDRDERDPWTVTRVRLEVVAADAGWEVAGLEVEDVAAAPHGAEQADLEGAIRDHMVAFRDRAGRPLPPGAPADRPQLERFVVEAMREAARAEVTVLNRGALRPVAARHIEVEPLRFEAVLRILSLPQELVAVELDGAALRSLVAAGTERVDVHGRKGSDALRFAGLEWSVDDAGQIEGLSVNGRQLRDSDSYRVATTAFLVEGGDRYEALDGAVTVPLPGGRDRLALRDEVVLPRIEAAADDFPDLAHEPVWRYAVSRLGLGLDSVTTDRSGGYDSVSDSRASAEDSSSLRADIEAALVREMPSWRWENWLRGRYALIDAEGSDVEELDDDLRVDSSAVFTRATVLGGASPYASAIVDSEFRPGRTDDGDELPRQLEESLSAGLTWSLERWPRLRFGGVARRYGNTDRPDQFGLLGEVVYRRQPAERTGWPGLEGRLTAEALRGGGSEVRRLDLDLRLLVPAYGGLLLSPAVNWYLYDDSALEGTARYLRYSVALSWSWQGRVQTR